jgi:hypothetical protein
VLGAANAANDQSGAEMSTISGVGMSNHRDPRVAAREAVARAGEDGGVERADFVLMFATVGYDQPTIVKAVRAAAGGAPLCGCSAEGVIIRAEPDETNFAVAVLLIRSDEITFQNGMVPDMAVDGEQVGTGIAHALRPDLLADARALLVFPDGMMCDFEGIRTGLEGALSLEAQLPLFGGTASDNRAWEKTYQYCDDEVLTGGVGWALLSGDVRVATAASHGCVSLGVTHEITRCEDTRIYELDGRPATDVLSEYMTPEEMLDWGMAVANMPLGFKAPAEIGDYDEYLIRVILTKDEANGSFTIPTRVTAGTQISMMRRDYDKIVSGVDRLGRELRAQLHDEQPKLVLQFECAGRGRTFLRDDLKLQLQQQLHDQLPAATWFGFYTYGEIGPVAENNCFHNYTSVVAALF